MALCLKFYQVTTGSNGTSYTVYYSEEYDINTCLEVTGGTVILSSPEYIQLKADSDAIANIADASAFVDPLEVSAVYGTSFALIFAISAIAYKIKVAKRIIRSA